MVGLEDDVSRKRKRTRRAGAPGVARGSGTTTAAARPEAMAAAGRPPVPWAVLWLGVIMLAGIFLPADWIVLWSKDDGPRAAQSAVLVGGFVGTTVFLHAIVVLQLAARSGGDDAVRAAKRTYEVALALTGIGVLVGTTMVFLQFNGAPDGVKVTGVLSDAATVGGIVGLIACLPHNLRVTFSTLRRMRAERLPHWFKVHMTLAVIDTYLLYRLLLLVTTIRS